MLAISFHIVFAFDMYRSHMVKDHIFIGWDMDKLRRFPRDSLEQPQWVDFLDLVNGIELKSVPNRLGWITDISDTFSVSSAHLS